MCRYFVYTKYIRYQRQSGGGEPNFQDTVPDIEKLYSKLLPCHFWITVSELENRYQTENGGGVEICVCVRACARACVCGACGTHVCVRACVCAM